MFKFVLRYIGSIFSKIKGTYKIYFYEQHAKRLKTDLNIPYPTYKSMDKFIDIEQLKSLDPIVIQFIQHYLNSLPQQDDRFHTGPFTLKIWQPKFTKAHLVELTQEKVNTNYNYFDLNKPDKWGMTPYAAQLPEVMKFIKTLPFRATGRIMLIFDTGGDSITPHRDHVFSENCHEFIWFNANKKKKFYVYHSGLKKYITSYSAWFDTVNQFHGTDPSGELNYSIRVDGIFTDEFQKQIPRPKINPASTPSLWASLDGG
jgi:hypothetical protein